MKTANREGAAGTSSNSTPALVSASPSVVGKDDSWDKLLSDLKERSSHGETTKETGQPDRDAKKEPSTTPVPTAVSIDSLIDSAQRELNSPISLEHLKRTRNDLAALPPTTRRSSEVRKLVLKLDKEIEAETKREASHWSYDEYSDGMGRGVAKYATLESENQIDLSFPYTGAQHVSLVVRRHPKFGKDILLKVQRGQFFCTGVYGCEVSVRFDNGPIQRFTGNTAEGGDSTVLFIAPYDRFMSQMRKAKTAKVEANFFQEGLRVLDFDVEGFEMR